MNRVTINGSAIKIRKTVAGMKNNANLLMLERYNSLISENLPLSNNSPKKPLIVPENKATPLFLINSSSNFK